MVHSIQKGIALMALIALSATATDSLTSKDTGSTHVDTLAEANALVSHNATNADAFFVAATENVIEVPSVLDLSYAAADPGDIPDKYGLTESNAQFAPNFGDLTNVAMVNEISPNKTNFEFIVKYTSRRLNC